MKNEDVKIRDLHGFSENLRHINHQVKEKNCRILKLSTPSVAKQPLNCARKDHKCIQGWGRGNSVEFLPEK